tara:strand:- start:46636 stop:46794 length:159 start_codon:yes stop_codon:yes gene_type:complete
VFLGAALRQAQGDNPSGSCQKCVAGAGLSCVGRAAFLHNVIIVHPIVSLDAG